MFNLKNVFQKYVSKTWITQHARRFYLGQWIRDAQITCEQLVKNPPKPPATKTGEEEKTEDEIKAEHEEKVVFL